MAINNPSPSPAWRQLRVPIVAVATALAAGLAVSAAAYFLIDEGNRSAYWLEAGKAGMQTVVVAAIGTIVTAAVKYTDDQRAAAQRRHERAQEEAHRREDTRRAEARRLEELRQAEIRRQEDVLREETRQRNDYRLELLRRLRAAYSAIKRVRRDLEHAGFKPESSKPFAPASGLVSLDGIAAYRAGMAQLRDAKLDLEAMREELEAGIGLGGSTVRLKGYLSGMETYIDDKVIDEQREIPLSTMANLNLLQVEELQRFVAAAHVAFGANVAVPYHEATRLLVADILAVHPDSATPSFGTTA